jgi:hypothetical protein
MGSRKDIEDQIAALQTQLADADADGYECHVQTEDGRTTRLTGKTAKSWLTKNGFLDADKTDDDGDGDGDGDDGKPDPKPKKTGSKFFD